MKVKVKTLKELIDEYGEPEITGPWIEFGSCPLFSNDMLEYLGKEIEINKNEQAHHWYWTGLYHKPEKKKLYAYSRFNINENINEIEFHKNDNVDLSFLTRTPEYDIEYSND